MNDDYDVIEMDFPEYQEEYPAIPDVEIESSFAAHKEEIYRRNRLIAAEEQTRILKEEEQQKAERRERTEELYKDAESAEAYVISRKMAVPIVIVFCVALFAIVALLNQNSRVTMEYAAAEAALTANTTVYQTAETEKVTRVTTERTRRETEAEVTRTEISETTVETTVETTTETTAKIPPEILKTTVVREPFAEDGKSYIFNTDVMSYRFTAENNGLNEYGVDQVTINVSVKNLTNYGYFVIPYFRSFRLTDSVGGNYQNLDLAYYDREHTHFSSPHKHSYDEEWHEGEPIAFSFNENSLCEFSLIAFFNKESDDNYDTFEYGPTGFPDYTKDADVGFKIPLEEILKYADL